MVLTVSDVTIRRDSRPVVERMSLEVPRGELVAIMGASGAGKTTILRAIAGLERLASGEIDVGGVRLSSDAQRSSVLRELHTRVGIVFQFHNLFANLTALQNVWLALVHVHRRPQPAAEAHARDLLRSLGIEHRADAFPHELSGGEAQRVAIARALAVDPPLLLMDEPTASLDATRRSDLADTLRSLVLQGRTLIIATHDAEFVRQCGARVVTLDGG